MKIATYNVWNENKGIGKRYDQLVNEIGSIDADIIGLQEVTEKFFTECLLDKTQYSHSIFEKYKNENEGLAILSKHPIEEAFFLNNSDEYQNSDALNVIMQVNNIKFSFTNLHLPWASALVKEQQITAINRYLHKQLEEVDFFILLGDFNCGYQSSIHNYLLGEQSLNGSEACPYWYELYSTYSILNNLTIKPTLDFVNNPRWKGENTIEIPFTADRIYMMYQYPPKYKERLLKADIFGTEISPENSLAASDHYGVYADIEILPKE